MGRIRDAPLYAGEDELQRNAARSLAEVNAAFDATIARLRAGDEGDARALRDLQAAPALERLDASLHALVDLNAARGSEQSAAIATTRQRSAALGASLYALSAVLACVAGFLLVRLVRRFARLQEVRATELEHFAARVAHDIRGPLGSVAMALDLLNRERQLGEKARSWVARGATTIRRVVRLVDDLLAFAVAGAPPPQTVHADVHEVVSGVVDGILPTAEEQDVRLQFEPAEGAVACNAGVLTSLLAFTPALHTMSEERLTWM